MPQCRSPWPRGTLTASQATFSHARCPCKTGMSIHVPALCHRQKRDRENGLKPRLHHRQRFWLYSPYTAGFCCSSSQNLFPQLHSVASRPFFLTTQQVLAESWLPTTQAGDKMTRRTANSLRHQCPLCNPPGLKFILRTSSSHREYSVLVSSIHEGTTSSEGPNEATNPSNIDTHICNPLIKSLAWSIWSSEKHSKNNNLIWCVFHVLSDLFFFH